MNCRQYEKLIPLFVEGDLDEDDLRKVATHVQGCHGCARLASHYKASQAWLHTLAPPEFDNAFYADLQQSVMREIKSQESRPSFFQWFTLRWKPAYAVAFVLLVLFGALVIYMQTNKPSANPGQIVERKGNEPQPKEEKRPQDEQLPQDKLPTPERDVPQHAGNYQRHSLPRHRENEPNLNLLPVKLEPIVESEISLINKDEINAEEMSEFGIFISSESMTRIELQTGDPNIRIIWFAPKTVELPKTITE